MTPSLLLAAALALTPAQDAPDQGHDPAAHFRIVGHVCDDSGAVVGLVVAVDAPGNAMIRWSNDAVCRSDPKKDRDDKPALKGTERL